MPDSGPHAAGRLPAAPTSASKAEQRERQWPWHTATLVGLLAGGTFIGAVCGALVGGLASAELQASTEASMSAIEWGAIGGGVGGAACVLFVAAAFAIHSGREDVRLVEAASPLHPLLRELMVRAPGTYAHSVAVANLAESAAERIGADALMVRVGAYYHDVGKIRRPCFFYENQAEGENPHETTKPKMSTAIITSHVDDGLELAERYDLPESVSEIISQHHGTSLVRYFFHKASQADAGVFEADFRYRGVKPQSAEAALVMLADASEAAVRALGDPDPERVEAVVRGVLAEKIADGQLDECGLSEAEQDTVVNTFTRQLVAICHARCEYPSLDELRPGGASPC